jgi:acyl-CoA thioesterase
MNINIPEGWRTAVDMEEVPQLDEDDASNEEWKRWKDSPYQVSNMGRVRRVNNDGTFKMRRPRDDDRGKYRMNATWVRNGVPHREEFFIHQAVMALFGPEKPRGDHVVVCHKKPTGEDGKPDNRLSNLYWCDRSRNVEDSWDDGLMEKGAKWKKEP